MNFKNIFVAYGVLLLGAVSLTSCSNDETYDVDGRADNLVYIDNSSSKIFNCEVIHTPVGEFGKVAASLPVKIQYASEDSVKVAAVADTTLVSKYNSENGTDYAQCPADVVNALKSTTTVIQAGKYVGKSSVDVTVPESKYSELKESSYLIPLRLKVVSAEGGNASREIGSSDNLGIAYIKVNTSNKLAKFSSNKTSKCSIVRTPVGVFGSISASLPVELKYALGSDVTTSVVADNNIVTDYNIANSKTYKALPSNLISAMKVTPAIVSAGKTVGAENIKVSVPTDLAKSLTEPAYVLPLVMQTKFKDGTTVLGNDTAYVIVETKESMINDNATSILGTKADLSDFTVVNAANLDKSNYSNLSKGSYWMYSKANTSSAIFTLDLKSIKSLSSFALDAGYVSTDFKVYVSSDNTKWTEVGKSTDHKGISGGWENPTTYVLYGGVPCRYVKFDITLDPNSYMWDYMSESWSKCCISALNLYFTE